MNQKITSLKGLISKMKLIQKYLEKVLSSSIPPKSEIIFLLQVKTYFTFKLVQRESAFLNKGVLRSRGVHYSDVFINQVISFSIDHYISGKHI